MSVTLSVGSLKICAFTLVVIQVSSMYSPVLDCCDVEAQPSAETIRAMMKSPEKRLSMVITNLLSASFAFDCCNVTPRYASGTWGSVRQRTPQDVIRWLSLKRRRASAEGIRD